MSDQMRAVVRDGYDRVDDQYLADRTRDADIDALGELVDRLAARSRVLDAGCGAGVPVGRVLLVAGLTTVGMDFSLRQLELACRPDPRVGPRPG